MPKKSSSKPPKPQDPVAIEEKKSSPAPKRPGKEIDEIFAAKKRKKPEQDKSKDPTKNEGAKLDKTKKKKKREAPNESETVDPPSRPRKRTGDGLTIYTEEELGVAKADAGVCMGLGAICGIQISKRAAHQGPSKAIDQKKRHNEKHHGIT